MIAIEYSKRLLGWVGRVILKIRDAHTPRLLKNMHLKAHFYDSKSDLFLNTSQQVLLLRLPKLWQSFHSRRTQEF